MGTTFSVKVVAPVPAGEAMSQAALDTAINRVLRRVNHQMSTYQPGSEISRFNRSTRLEWTPISPEFASVLATAIQISELSGGAFDFTVGPLVNLWGFGPENRPRTIPREDEIAERKAAVGYQNVVVRQSPPAVKKLRPDIYCDLSAIAKGFGVDQVAGYLDSLDLRNFMVEIGGEVVARGLAPEGRPWQIGVETPDAPAGIQKILPLTDMAVATSGDYFNYFEEDGQRYSHTIDPRTGRPITHKLASVTVVQKSCMLADGLATALDVLGPEAGYDFAVKKELAAFMIVRSGTGFIEKKTPAFERIFAGAAN